MNKTKEFKAPSAKTLKKWERMTDRNFHSEVLVDAAEWFAKETEDYVLTRLVDAFKYILKVHNETGYMPSELDILRNCSYNEFKRRIEELYPNDCGTIFSCF